ncbi:MAG: orotate phosphoribosyltransferase [Erysipelotrichaceae bacterium]|nr:orotate phosphoribosyltransferase [Erysipelotrichaceae bacterium]
MNDTSKRIARHLLDIQAVTLSPNDPYTWASGIKSPIYCDNRITMSYPLIRQDIAKSLVELIRKEYPETEVIAGTATAGIPQACWVADLMNLPMVYIRSKAKDHGKENQIEGRISKGQKMVVIEDLISTGGSVLDACEAASREGALVLGVAAIFTYELPKGLLNFKDKNIKLYTLTNYSVLVEEALKSGYIKENDLETLKEWKKNPAEWRK